ncbi:MAG: AraC family transcriptional regulator [Prevotella sp.]|nr:AraC family transcriptional regulator [Prevotella sp.]MBR6445740.1 AraC family transcriptional regulator [Prevotella sp.]MBR6495165.1 AraC family transcriptional regulator [Prevotella sp.]
MDKTPKLMNYSRMKELLSPHIAQIREKSFISRELGMIHGDPSVFLMILKQNQPPFSIDDYRLGVVVRGEIRASINLVERRITAGTLVFLGPGSILSPISFSEDIEIYGMTLFADFPMPFATGQMPMAFNGQIRDFQIQVGESDIATVRHILDTIWQAVHQSDYNRQTVSSLVAALMHHYDGLYRQHTEWLQASQSREQTIFDRFIQLVNQHCAEQHKIGYYANRMCLTERYLSTIIRQTSGVTAKEWIDRAIITRIKVELKHTDKSVARISDDMNFPNPSFFSKYFKRFTKQTPLEYKLSN